MPRITRGSHTEHRVAVVSALLDGTERILLGKGGRKLTASAVAAEAGIARNSIYRYVRSVDDLVEMVVARDFEDWRAQVESDVAASPDARSAVVAYVRSNLTLASAGEHKLHQALAGAEISESARERIRRLHHGISAVLHEAVGALVLRDPDLVEIAIAALVERTMPTVVADPAPQRVIDFACAATESIVAANTCP